jgi:hypothetical protein
MDGDKNKFSEKGLFRATPGKLNKQVIPVVCASIDPQIDKQTALFTPTLKTSPLSKYSTSTSSKQH